MSEQTSNLIDEIIAEYIRAEETGEAPDREALLEQHPDLAEELREFFDDRDQFQQLASPFTPPVMAQVPPLSKIRYFGDYELLEEIARGGMGIVYKARQESLNRIVAVKMILSGHLATKDDVKRFKTEAEAAAGLQHPGIVPVYEVGTHEGQHFFSMEYVDGKTLADLIRDNPLPAHQAARYVQEIAETVAYAHQHGTLHRDLKPSNLIIDSRDDSVRITDFGLAMRVGGESELTRTGQILGTPSYMSPEQAESKRGLIGTGSDVYSMGVVLYELLTGRPPFRAETAVETIRQVIETEAPSPRLLNPSVPKDLETICLKCLEKEPHKRYVTSAQLAEDLNRYLNGEPILARRINKAARVLRWCRRKPAMASAYVTGVLALITTFVGILIQYDYSRVRKAFTEEKEMRQTSDNRRRELETVLRESRWDFDGVTEPRFDPTSVGLVIQEGSGLLGLTVGESLIEDVESILGKPFSVQRAGVRARNYFYQKGLAFNIYDDGPVNTIFTGPSFGGKTSKGIVHGDLRKKVVQVYGPPSKEMKYAKQVSLLYPGIIFKFDAADRVNKIVVIQVSSKTKESKRNFDGVTEPRFDPTSVELVLQEGSGLLGLTIGESRIEDVESVLGKPLTVKRVSVGARNYFYLKGLAFNIYDDGLVNTIFTGPSFSGNTSKGISHGDMREKVIQVYGPSINKMNGVKKAYLAYPGVIFWFDKTDRVNKIVVAQVASKISD